MQVCSQLRAFPASLTSVSSVGEAGLTSLASSCIFLCRVAGGFPPVPDTAVFCRWCVVWIMRNMILVASVKAAMLVRFDVFVWVLYVPICGRISVTAVQGSAD